MTHHHDLIRRMAAELDHYRQLVTDDRREVHPLAEEARAVLAASVTSPPDWRGLCEELLRGLDENRHPEVRYPGHLRLVMASAREALSQPEPEVVGPGLTDQELLAVASGLPVNPDDDDILSLQRATIAAALARWGRPAPALAGEVREVVNELNRMADEADFALQFSDADCLSRAADLLERQATACAICERERLHQSTRAADLEMERQADPVPVAISDRLPRPKDCDAEGRCWAYDGKHLPAYMTGPWQLRELPNAPLVAPNERSITSNYFWRNTTHWLPAHALPLPSGEVAA